MDPSQANMLVALVGTAGYLLLLLLLARQHGRWRDKQAFWLFTYLALSAVWQLSLLPIPALEGLLPNASSKILLVGTLLLGLSTAAFVDWTNRRYWLLGGGAAIIATILLELFLPVPLFAAPEFFMLEATVGGFATLITWLVLTTALPITTWRSYRSNPFPWHANRLLYWAAALLIILVGEVLLFFSSPWLSFSGQGLRLLGAGALAYGVSSHRLFDVQGRIRRSLAFVIIVSMATGIAYGVFVATQWVTRELPSSTSTALILLLIVAGFLLYQPFRRLAERTINPLLLGEEFDTSKVVRSYSQAISRTLDVEQLSLVIIGTLSELFETNRGALLLATRLKEGYEVEPIPAMGRISRQKMWFAADSLLFATLAGERQPLLQYELDFNPQFQALSAEERTWLSEMGMEVYVPISTETEIAGLIALGPKISGLTYRQTELELVQTLADQTVVALENARLYSELGSQNEKIRLLNVDLRRQNERLEIMDKVKSDFITIASHELRTPLTQVKGYADILQAMNEENVLNREQTREIVGHINRASLQLEQLISAMLDASQLDVNGLKLNFVPTKVDTILRLAVEPLAKAIRERRLAFKLEGIQNLPTLQADFKRLVQAFSNILGNAVKYTPDGGTITVTGTLVPSNDGQDYVEIIISDTGIGIDSKFHELIFEKFFRIGDPQLHSTGNTKFKGAGPGLGLPIAKGVIEAHFGRIWVESDGEDETRLPGSRFHVILPICPPGALLQQQTPIPALQAQPQPERPAWLVG
jgi:signal transduction histidine kinase